MNHELVDRHHSRTTEPVTTVRSSDHMANRPTNALAVRASSSAAAEVVRRFASSAPDDGPDAPSFGSMSAGLTANEPERDGDVQVIRRVPLQAMMTQLHDASGKRSDKNYQRLVALLTEAAGLEAKAMTAEEFVALLPRIDAIEHQLAATTSKTLVRRQALATLGTQLAAKRTELTAKAHGDQANVRDWTVGAGPKAGFEHEFKVYVFDIEKSTPALRRELVHRDFGDPKFPEDTWYPKDKRALFVSPNGSWEGQADTSSTKCSVLEIVTKPLTPGEWESAEVLADQALMRIFIAALEAAKNGVHLHPMDLADGIVMTALGHGARLFKPHSGAQMQTQMTRAEPLAANGDDPAYWIPGLDHRVVPLLRKTIKALETTSLLGTATNPKSAFGKIIVKTPILALLGRPTGTITDDQRDDWVRGVLTEIKRPTIGAEIVARPLVEATAKASKSPNMQIDLPTFTYDEYLHGLIASPPKDLVTAWATTAFSGDEDMGLGQIPEHVPDHAVIEYRTEYETLAPDQFVATAQQWGRGVRPAPGH